MTKKVLIIGTSHSEASCVTETNPVTGDPVYTDDSLIEQGLRWFDYIEHEFDAKVTKLARAGCTSLDQYYMLINYFSENPDAEFDVALIEGRGTEANYNVTTITEGKELTSGQTSRMFYDRWLDPQYRELDNIEFEKWGRLSPYDVTEEMLSKNHQHHYLVNHMSEYLMSDLHHMQNLAVNHALCELVNTRAVKTKWFTLTFEGWRDTDIIDRYMNTMADFILDKEDFISNPETSVVSESREEWEKLFCKCGHMNEDGHKRFWDLLIRPRIQKWFT